VGKHGSSGIQPTQIAPVTIWWPPSPRLDILVANAGVSKTATIEAIEDFDKLFAGLRRSVRRSHLAARRGQHARVCGRFR
jgi:NAD(P)-dependent dehydrogenase (short-subunit alcohol dehydrogenase family)